MSAGMVATSAPPRRRGAAAAAVEAELREFFRRRAAAAAAYGPSFERLWTIASESAPAGKLVRPMLLLDTFDALRPSGADDRSRTVVVEVATAVELLHLAFLLHDDVIDGDLTRRGRDNLIGRLLAEVSPQGSAGDAGDEGADLHWARAGGILMGDLLLARTHQVFARAPLPREQRLRLLDLLDDAVTESVAGEELDVGLGDGVVAPEPAVVLAMSRHKTAAYTFELPLRAAAVLAEADSGVEAALAAIGRHLGLAFQLQDDLLSTFGDPSHHGKDAFSDLRRGKQTAIIAYARRTSAWREIAPSFGCRDLTASEGARLRGLLVDCGAERYVEGLVDAEFRAGDAVIARAGADIPPRVRRVLRDLVARLDGRRR